jgi:hypothetical protein
MSEGGAQNGPERMSDPQNHLPSSQRVSTGADVTEGTRSITGERASDNGAQGGALSHAHLVSGVSGGSPLSTVRLSEENAEREDVAWG